MTTGTYNPDPNVFKKVEDLENDFLSPSRLQDISGSEDLNEVQSIEIKVNTKETTVGNFGKYLPALTQLTLNNSFIPSIRDIGTSFHCLTTLYLSKCCLSDVDGIATIQNLTKLDISSNNVSDISPISFLDNLRELNASDNSIDNVGQIDYLTLLAELVILIITDNPVCDNNEDLFRDYVLSKLPNLQILNGENCSTAEEALYIVDSPCKSNSPISTVTVLKTFCDNENYDSRSEKAADADHVSSNRPVAGSFGTPKLRDTSTSPSRPTSASSKTRQGFVSKSVDFTLSRPDSSGSNPSLPTIDDSSMLTFGSLFYGNPLHALKDRKKAPPSPLIAMLSKEPDVTRTRRQRPATAIGLRRSVKAISEDQLKTLQSDLQKSFKKTDAQKTVDSNTPFTLRSPCPPPSKSVSVFAIYLLI